MVRRLFAFALRSIDAASGAQRRNYGGAVDMVDAQAEVFEERQATIIPPRKQPRLRVMDAHQVDHAVGDVGKCRAFWWATQHRIGPGQWIVDIGVSWRDVHVAT